MEIRRLVDAADKVSAIREARRGFVETGFRFAGAHAVRREDGTWDVTVRYVREEDEER